MKAKLFMRRFMKKLLTIRWMFVVLLVLCLGIVAIVYFTVDLKASDLLVLDNIEFTTDGFEDFNGKEEPVFNDSTDTWWIGDKDTGITALSSSDNGSYTEKDGYWYINDINTNVKASMLYTKVVGKTSTHTMFIDESTTIITVVENSSLIEGGDANNPDDYKIKYASAQKNSTIAKSANFYLTYASGNISNPHSDVLNSYSQSVLYSNILTGNNDRHYSIKYLEDDNAVQVYYTIGKFSSVASYFSSKLYETLYEPARCLFDTDDQWKDAVKEYENGYLETVGSLYNTFEERFRGNVKVASRADYDASVDKFVVNYRTNLYVYSQEALEYILDVVFPALEEDGIDCPDYDKEALFDEAKQKAIKNDNYSTVEWTLNNVPVELVDCDGEYYNKYFNVEGSPLTNNPFMLNTDFTLLSPNYYQYIKADGNTVLYAYYSLNINPGPASTSLYKLLYDDSQTMKTKGDKEYEVVKLVDGEYVPFASTGYVARDENGNALRDEEGKLIRQLYTLDQVEEDNALFGVSTEGLAVFKIALEFKLTSNGLVVSVPRDSLVDSSNVSEDDPDYNMINGEYLIASVQICPNMTSADTTQEGYMVIPDGSGAIINFNNNKISTISASYYGDDLAYVDGVQTEETAQLLLGMFAFVNTTSGKEGGLLAVIEKGGGQMTLTAGVNANENFANLTAELRGHETIVSGTVSDNRSFAKYDKTLTPSDIVVNYLIIEENETDYSSIAKKYQAYLIERDGLTFTDTTDTLLNDLTFLGTFEKYSLLLGIKYKTSDTLTTFTQAEEIIDELSNNGLDNITVSYKGWTNEELEYELGGTLKVSKDLGKAKSLRSFYSYCIEKNISLYLELNVTTTKGYDYMLGSNRYSARGVGNEEAIHYEYDLSTGRPNKELNPTYVISPLYYESITNKLISDFNKLSIWNEKQSGGFYLTDLGNQWTGNYRNNRQVYGGDAILYQQQSLEALSEGSKIKIEAPCDYAFKYVDVATGVPVNSCMYAVYDATIPFYQLVISGLFDYTTEHINGLENKSSAWYLVKILESGSNASYLLSAEDPSVLLETDYTQYYQAYYQNWKDTIISFTKEINSLGIASCYLTKHETINGLSRVTYTSKTNASDQKVLIINLTDTSKTYTDGTVVPAYSYVVE